MTKQALVSHSGGMDSSLCLALAAREFGKEHVLSVSFDYHQRNAAELAQAEKICADWGIDHDVVSVPCFQKVTHNALTDPSLPIQRFSHAPPNTLVVGRNGLMARLGAIYAEHLGLNYLYMGIHGLERAHSGYRDCSRSYMDLKQQILRLDLNNPHFEIRTPVVDLTKKQTLELAHQLGLLTYLLEETITCYEGIGRAGCKTCPACLLRNEGIKDFLKENPTFAMPYAIE